jgi:hypothetical protein
MLLGIQVGGATDVVQLKLGMCDASLQTQRLKLHTGLARLSFAEVVMTEAIEKREQARHEMAGSLMFIGLALWVAGALVTFFLPAGMKLGRQEILLAIIGALAIAGLALMIKGYLMRGQPDE